MNIKKPYDPETGQYVKERVYGEGIFDSVKSVESTLFGRTAKKNCLQNCF